MALIDKLTAIANAIRGKTGKAEEMTLDQMVTEIEGIEAGGGGQWTTNGLASGREPNGHITITEAVQPYMLERKPKITGVTINASMRRAESLFQLCNGLKTADITTTDAGMAYKAFSSCTALESVVYRGPASTAKYMFENCGALKIFEGGPEFSGFNGTGVFLNCKVLDKIIFRSPSVVTLNATDSFNNTPFNGYNGLTGTVYVPAALISEYQQATNWSTMYAAGTCNFVAIEGSEYE